MTANFISFVNSPVYLGTVEGQVPETGVGGVNNLLAANSCEVSFETNLEAQKYLGRNPLSNDFSVNGPKNSKISVSYIPLVGDNLNAGVQQASLLPLSLTGDFESGHCIRVGNFVFKKCYLDSLTIQINPNTPVRWTTQFSSYDTSLFEGVRYTGSVDSSGFTVNPLSGASFSCVHALAMNVSGSTSLPASKTDISITYQINRTPVYEVGSTEPRTVFLNSVSRTTNISAENIAEVVNFSGKDAVLNLKFAEFGKLMDPNFNATQDFRFGIDVTGKISSQNLSMAPSRVLEGQIQILENLF